MPRSVLLSGEHASLPAAELRALLAVHDPLASIAVHGLAVQIESGRLVGGVDKALARMALAHAWGEPWAEAPDSAAGLQWLHDTILQRADGRGSAAIVTERRGAGKDAQSKDVGRALGAALKQRGHTIDLVTPECAIYAWIAEGRIRVGEQMGVTDRPSYEKRANDQRAHFSPVALHPRRAAALLHLARAVPGATVYDPFCGTGTFVLEAAMEGYKAVGSDVDAFMVQGTLETLADAGPEPLDGVCFVADIGDAPDLVGPVDAIVTDLPYGRASGTDGEAISALYTRAMKSFAALLPTGAHAVIGCAQPELLADIENRGFAVVERHSEAVHRSLTRHFIVVKRVPGVGEPG